MLKVPYYTHILMSIRAGCIQHGLLTHPTTLLYNHYKQYPTLRPRKPLLCPRSQLHRQPILRLLQWYIPQLKEKGEYNIYRT